MDCEEATDMFDLGRQGIDGDQGVLETIERLGGLNAQTARGPSVGLRARVRGFEQDQLDRLLRDHKVVKANLLRGTVHMVTARQYLAWRVALQPALERTLKQFCPRLWQQVDHDELLDAGVRLLRKEAGRDGLTRGELGERLQDRFPKASAADLGFAVRLLAPVVQVPDPSGWHPGRTRYVLAESVLKGAEAVTDAVLGGEAAPEGALADLLTTYLTVHGPATAADTTYHLGLTGLAAPLKEVAEIVGGTGRTPLFDAAGRSPGDECAQPIDAAGRPLANVPAQPSRKRGAARKAGGSVVILPEYDLFWFGHKSEPFASARKQLIPNTATDMLGSVLVDGRLVATWRPRKDTVEVDGTLPKAAAKEFDAFRAWYEATSAATRRVSEGA